MMEMVWSKTSLYYHLTCNNDYVHHTVKVSCSDLPNPANGQVSVNDINNVEGSIASYSCDSSYNLIGNAMRTCQNVGSPTSGEWSGSDPTCQRKLLIRLSK